MGGTQKFMPLPARLFTTSSFKIRSRAKGQKPGASWTKEGSWPGPAPSCPRVLADQHLSPLGHGMKSAPQLAVLTGYAFINLPPSSHPEHC